MKIIGHRGAKGLAPENSLLSIRVALREHVDVIELDVQTQDGVLVLSHDTPEKNKSYATLSDALKLVHGKASLNLEIKDVECVPLLKKALKSYKGEIVFSSFSFKTLQAIRSFFPKHEIAVLEKWSGVRAITKASVLHTHRVHINHKVLWSGFVKSMKHKGYTIYAYTVNLSDRAEELESWGVDGIFTDYPNLFSERP